MSAAVTGPTLAPTLVRLLRELHQHFTRMARLYTDPGRPVPFPPFDQHQALEYADRATRIVHELRDAGHDAEADALRKEAEGLERVLLEGDRA